MWVTFKAFNFEVLGVKITKHLRGCIKTKIIANVADVGHKSTKKNITNRITDFSATRREIKTHNRTISQRWSENGNWRSCEAGKVNRDINWLYNYVFANLGSFFPASRQRSVAPYNPVLSVLL